MSYFTSKYYILGLAYATFENHCTLLYKVTVHGIALRSDLRFIGLALIIDLSWGIWLCI